MALNSYILYTENIPHDRKQITHIGYMVQKNDGLANEWLQEKYYAAV
jgi:hypothetical protein